MSNKKSKIQKDVGPVLENTVNSDPKPLETPQNLESSRKYIIHRNFLYIDRTIKMSGCLGLGTQGGIRLPLS